MLERKLIILISILILSFSLVGCGDETESLAKEGEVYQKEIREEKQVTEESYNSSTRSYKTYLTTYPQAYIIYVKYKKDYGDKGNIFYNTFAFYVSKDIFDNVNIGDKYLYNDQKDSMELEYIKREEIKDE